MALCSASGRLIRFRLVYRLFLVLALGSPLCFGTYQGAAAAPQEDDQFKAGVQAYNQNHFSAAENLLKSVTGTHAQEAKQYVDKIQRYRNALQLANSEIQRSPDELDPDSLKFAIESLQEAIEIKADGPWDPQGKLAQAKALREKVLQQTQVTADARDRSLCAKALEASKVHRYKDAKQMSCLIANDNPAYQCGGNEVVMLCNQMSDLAAINAGESSRGAALRAADASVFEKGKAAYDKNDFSHARVWFQHVGPEDKDAAADYLDEISRFEQAMKNATSFTRSADWDQARSSYRDAASIAPNGPGNPQQQIALLDLEQGIDGFYAGNYEQASRYLEAYAAESSDHPGLLHFYSGATKLAKFFQEGTRNNDLHNQALEDFRKAKAARFVPDQHADLSPKILREYQQLASR